MLDLKVARLVKQLFPLQSTSVSEQLKWGRVRPCVNYFYSAVVYIFMFVFHHILSSQMKASEVNLFMKVCSYYFFQVVQCLETFLYLKELCVSCNMFTETF